MVHCLAALHLVVLWAHEHPKVAMASSTKHGGGRMGVAVKGLA
jgi:hypothetical protein